MSYIAFEPDTEVVGYHIQGLIGSLVQAEVQPLLDRYQLADVDLAGWYRQQKVLDLFTELESMPTSVVSFVAMGMHNADLFPHPKGITLGEVLARLPDDYASGYRNGNPGYLIPQQITPQHWRVTTWVPYPADFFYGIFYGLTRRFTEADCQVRVEARPVAQHTTLFDIQWEKPPVEQA